MLLVEKLARSLSREEFCAAARGDKEQCDGR